MAERDALPAWVRPLGDGAWSISVRVQPGAKKNEVVGEAEGRLRLRIMAQAIDNKANKALVAFVAKLLEVRPKQLSLSNGESSRQKTLLLTETPAPDWEKVYPAG